MHLAVGVFFSQTKMTPLLISSFILGIAFCAPPGIITTETIRRGAARGFGPALSVQFGSLIGDTTWAAIALTGLAFVIQNDAARIVLSLVGIVLMVKLAFDAIKDAHKGAHPANGTAQTSSHSDFVSGAFLSLGNPMNIVFWTGLGTTVFASIAGTPQPMHFVTFFTGFLGGAIAWCFFIAGLVAWGRKWMTVSFFRFLNAACGLVLFYFAFQLGLQTVQSFI